ncbi:acetyltransferase, GNAT family [Nitrosococcus oceani AFC27]|uniref:N-acetyltransferase domain-containing protein n=1 Tax=Nitrosococcus oceani C-27 TaxID=314279 RepID=A0A0E2YXU7_9GAMM|nr:GNAT family N-acetyltransferase [Nitrosococcus oceani]EDZ65500.1 acetyltransferase, GNAT family [Nitrosococcus oceani AFC27]KFI18243.1 hypothetical protein IB75_15445 [Nitrosococcus oceani C-27]GEM20073.1 N-acetyltransferase [Nitrosococcus oceani]
MINLAKELSKKLARLVLGDYSAYYVYASPVDSENSAPTASRPKFSVRATDQQMLELSSEPLIREQMHYLGEEAYAYACYLDNRIAGVCIYWYGERYRKRDFWPLRNDEAKLVQIVTSPSMRRSGVATQLIALSCLDMLKRGFRRTYARIWHSNSPSLRAFERAGWSKVALVIEINPLRLRRPNRIRFNSRS